MQAKESESGGLGWVGLHQHHTSTDMVPSEGEDGVGWPGLCSLDRGASRRPMIGNQIAAHPSPSSCHRCRCLTLRFRDSPPPRPPGNPPTVNHSPLLSAFATLSRAYSLGENESLSFSVSLVFCNSLRLSSCLSFSLAPSRRFNFGFLPSSSDNWRFHIHIVDVHIHRCCLPPAAHLPQGR